MVCVVDEAGRRDTTGQGAKNSLNLRPSRVRSPTKSQNQTWRNDPAQTGSTSRRPATAARAWDGAAAPRTASSGAGRAPRRRDARRSPSCAQCARCRRAGVRGLEVPPRRLGGDLLVERQAGGRLAQPRILRLRTLQPLPLVRPQAPNTPMARIASATLRSCDTGKSTCRGSATISSGSCPFFAIPGVLRRRP